MEGFRASLRALARLAQDEESGLRGGEAWAEEDWADEITST